MLFLQPPTPHKRWVLYGTFTFFDNKGSLYWIRQVTQNDKEREGIACEIHRALQHSPVGKSEGTGTTVAAWATTGEKYEMSCF